eukprot:608171-Pyramimonas_sp.AAC.1
MGSVSPRWGLHSGRSRTAVPEGLPKGLDRYLRKRKVTFLTNAGDIKCNNSPLASPLASPIK